MTAHTHARRRIGPGPVRLLRAAAYRTVREKSCTKKSRVSGRGQADRESRRARDRFIPRQDLANLGRRKVFVSTVFGDATRRTRPGRG